MLPQKPITPPPSEDKEPQEPVAPLIQSFHDKLSFLDGEKFVVKRVVPIKDKTVSTFDAWGDTAVFSVFEANGKQRRGIYLYSLKNATLSPLISKPNTDNYDPAIYEDAVVWLEGTSEQTGGAIVQDGEESYPQTSMSYRIALYDIKTGATEYLSRSEIARGNLPSNADVYGNFIIWEEQYALEDAANQIYTNYIYLYDRKTRQTKRIDKALGTYPSSPRMSFTKGRGL